LVERGERDPRKREREKMAKTVSVSRFTKGENGVPEIVDCLLESHFEEAGRLLEHERSISAFATHCDAPEILIDIDGLNGGAMARLDIEGAIALRKELNKAINAARKFA
jgi:hypothetical protein